MYSTLVAVMCQTGQHSGHAVPPAKASKALNADSPVFVPGLPVPAIGPQPPPPAPAAEASQATAHLACPATPTADSQTGTGQQASAAVPSQAEEATAGPAGPQPHLQAFEKGLRELFAADQVEGYLGFLGSDEALDLPGKNTHVEVLTACND
jgi:hypothetical protein